MTNTEQQGKQQDEDLRAASFKQEAEIRQEAEQQPLVGEVKPFENLLAEFQHTEAILKKLQKASIKYCQYRAIRRDGCCFYRSYSLAVFEYFLRDELARPLLSKILDANRKRISEAG